MHYSGAGCAANSMQAAHFESFGAEWPRGDGQMARRIRAHDWASTPLGPIEGWPASLRVAVELMLASPVPLHVYWGHALVTLYNDAAIALEDGHPQALGLRAEATEPELWRELFAPVFADMLHGHGAALARDRQRTQQRDGQRR